MIWLYIYLAAGAALSGVFIFFTREVPVDKPTEPMGRLATPALFLILTVAWLPVVLLVCVHFLDRADKDDT
jgi:hypothetical protein